MALLGDGRARADQTESSSRQASDICNLAGFFAIFRIATNLDLTCSHATLLQRIFRSIPQDVALDITLNLMLGPKEQAAVKAVLQDLAHGVRVEAAHIHNLVGVELRTLREISDTYPRLNLDSFDDVDLAIHNCLNLYVNGISLRDQDWFMLGTSREDVERAFLLWQRQV